MAANALQQGIQSNSLHLLVQQLEIDLSKRLCMGSWPDSAHSSEPESVAKMSKSGTNSPNVQFRRLSGELVQLLQNT